jgi:hypothetical protein
MDRCRNRIKKEAFYFKKEVKRDINWAENELVVKDGSKVKFVKLTSR